LATISAISVTLKNWSYWTVLDRESTAATFANSESCSSARICASGTICAYMSIVVEMREWRI
jgi:hypothetical protein